MGRFALLFLGFALLVGAIFGGYVHSLAGMLFALSDHFHRRMLPMLKLVLMLSIGAIASGLFLYRSRLPSRLPVRFDGRSWIIWGLALQLLAVPLFVGVLAYLVHAGKASIGSFAMHEWNIHEWFGLPGLILLLVGCTKALLAAYPEGERT